MQMHNFKADALGLVVSCPFAARQTAFHLGRRGRSELIEAAAGRGHNALRYLSSLSEI